MPTIVPASTTRSAADGPGSVRARLIDRIGVGGMTLDRITLEVLLAGTDAPAGP